MLARGLGRRLPTLTRLVQSAEGSPGALLDVSSCVREGRGKDGAVVPSSSNLLSRFGHFSRGRS